MYRKIFFAVLLISLISIFISCGNKSAGTPSPKNDQEKPKPASTKTGEKKEQPASPPVDLSALEKKYRENPTDYPSVYEFALANKNAGKYDKALEILDGYISNKTLPDVSRARIERALVVAATGKVDEAYSELKDLTKDKSDDIKGEAFYQLGNLITEYNYNTPDGDKVTLAIKYYESSMDLVPPSGILYKRLANLMYSEGQIEKAREYLAIFLSVYPEDGQSWLDLANWSVEVKDLERAKEYYKRASESGEDEVKKNAQKALANL